MLLAPASLSHRQNFKPANAHITLFQRIFANVAAFSSEIHHNYYSLLNTYGVPDTTIRMLAALANLILEITLKQVCLFSFEYEGEAQSLVPYPR